MCLAIFKPAGIDVPTDHLKKGWVHNSDGGGFAFVNDGKISVVKGFMTWKEWLDAFNEAEFMFPDSPFLIHFRIRSMGDRNAENTHPYELPDGMGALIHNGTLRGTGAEYMVGPSDTALFVKKFGKALTFDNVQAEKKLLESAIDSYNKFAILYADGRHHILNEEEGVTINGVWYSNDTFLPWQERTNGSYCYT
jgi:predicted glutamine amidotransferase